MAEAPRILHLKVDPGSIRTAARELGASLRAMMEARNDAQVAFLEGLGLIPVAEPAPRALTEDDARQRAARAMTAAVGVDYDTLPDALKDEVASVAADLLTRMERTHG